MKFKLATAGLVAIALTPTMVLAQSKADNFKGLNFSLGASVQQSSMDAREYGNGTWSDVVTVDATKAWEKTSGDYVANKLTIDGPFSYDRTTALPTKGQVLPEIELSYNLKVSDSFLLGLSLGSDFGKKKSRSVNKNTVTGLPATKSDSYPASEGYDPGELTGGAGTPGGSWTSKATGSYVVSDRTVQENSLGNKIFIALKPSIAITESTMIFAKISYNQAKADIGGEKVTVRGAGFGLGFETNLSKSWFLRGEIEGVKFSGDKDYLSYVVNNDITAGSDYASVTSNGTTNVASYANKKLDVEATSVGGKIALGYRF